jgi:hypothetical protein
MVSPPICWEEAVTGSISSGTALFVEPLLSCSCTSITSSRPLDNELDWLDFVSLGLAKAVSRGCTKNVPRLGSYMRVNWTLKDSMICAS